MAQISTDCPNITLDDVAGREYLKDIIRGAVYNKDSCEAMKIGKVGAYMIVGPEGSGRTYLGCAIAGEFGKRKYSYLCCNIDKSGSFPEQFCDRVLKELKTSNTFLAIKNIERLDDSCEIEALLKSAEKLKSALTVVAVPKCVSDVDMDVSRLFTYIYVSLPNLNQRKTYFKEAMRGEPLAVREKLAEKTEGCGYSQMSSLVSAIRLSLKTQYEKGNINDGTAKKNLEEIVDKLLKDYKPKQTSYVPSATVSMPNTVAEVPPRDKGILEEKEWEETLKSRSLDDVNKALEEERKRELENLEKTLAEMDYTMDIDDFPD